MSDSPDVEYLKPFIESTVAAAARFRRVLIVMITASVLAFGASWNSKEEGWFNSRVMAARKGEAYLKLEEAQRRLARFEQELGEMGKRQEPDPARQQVLEDERRRKAEDERTLLAEVNRVLRRRFDRQVMIAGSEELLCELVRQDYDRVREWINKRAMPDEGQAGQYALKLEEARTANVILVHIPFFGLVFDVNDLGLWGGFTFTVILLLFRFTLWREYNNLRLTFLAAKPEHLGYCYKSLAMQQVMTVPPTLSQDRPPHKPWGPLVRSLYLPPLLTQAAILYQDYSTIPIGAVFHPGNTRISIIGSAIFLGIIVVLTIQCLLLSIAIDKEWKRAAESVRQFILNKWLVE